MNKEDKDRVFCTNMSESDPIIERFMREYLKEKEEHENKSKCKSGEDIIVNFDVTYPDGVTNSYTCGRESDVFGGREEKSCINMKIHPEEMKSHFSESVEKDIPCEDIYNKNMNRREKFNQSKCESRSEERHQYNQDYKYNEKEYNTEPKHEQRKHEKSPHKEEYNESNWINCESELRKMANLAKESSEYNNINEYEDRKNNYEEKKKEKKVTGNVRVYSTFINKFGKKIKGVKINLYKLNGISPQLVDSKETDCNGMVLFSDIPEGSYRVIELIDKRYFQKPIYINWNEVTISSCENEFVIYVINNLKKMR